MSRNTTSSLFSPYKITWIELTPVKGIVTKHDSRIFGDFYRSGDKTYFRRWFANKDQALAWVRSLDGSKLDKAYTYRYFFDAQMRYTSFADNYAIHYTAKQIAETGIINK